MEDFMKFLVLAGVIAFGIYRQFAKDKTKETNNNPSMPLPEYEMEVPIPSHAPQKRTPKKQSLPQEGVRTTQISRLHSSSDIAAAPPIELIEEDATDGEFSIQSTEEARRAIIWSEILQRKY